MKRIIKKFYLALAILFLILSAFCGKAQKEKTPETTQQETELSPKENINHENFLKIKGIKIKVEIADTPEKTKAGLMFRTKLAENEGMLFVFPYPDIHSFWMKNTYIPLSVAFINSEGTIVSIQDMQPLDESPHVSPALILYALEMNQSWFKRHDVRVGDKVEF